MYYESDVGVTEFGFVINIVIVIVVSFHLAVETLHWVYILLPLLMSLHGAFVRWILLLHIKAVNPA